MPPLGLALVSLGGFLALLVAPALAIFRRRWHRGGSMATILFVRVPDILVSGDAKLVAINEADGSLRLSDSRANVSR
jgi:hypothetical protein